jgi:hypothetical protein
MLRKIRQSPLESAALLTVSRDTWIADATNVCRHVDSPCDGSILRNADRHHIWVNTATSWPRLVSTRVGKAKIIRRHPNCHAMVRSEVGQCGLSEQQPGVPDIPS